MNLSTISRHRVRAAALGGLAVVSIAGAGLAIAPAAGATTGTPECRTPDLGFALKAGSPGAGQRYATVVLTDTSGHTCSITGYGGLALLGAPGQGVPTDLQRSATPPKQTVILAPGQSARSLLHWSVVPGTGESGSACEPTATTVVVTPPDETTSALLPWSLGPVCEHGLIEQQAYVPGSAAF